MQTQYQAHDKPGGGDITCKSKNTLGNEKPEEMWTDSEAEFLLNIALEHRVQKMLPHAE